MKDSMGPFASVVSGLLATFPFAQSFVSVKQVRARVPLPLLISHLTFCLQPPTLFPLSDCSTEGVRTPGNTATGGHGISLMDNGVLDNIEETMDPTRIDSAWEQIYNLLKPRRRGKFIG